MDSSVMDFGLSDLPGLLTLQEELAQMQHDGLMNINDLLDLPPVDGIEATDVGSLLQQFEEASDDLGECDGLQPSINVNVELQRAKAKKLELQDPEPRIATVAPCSATPRPVQSVTTTTTTAPAPPPLQNKSTTQLTDENDSISAPSVTEKLNKIKAAAKRKSTIMLPMGMPSKRGRGRAMALPANLAPPKVQRIMTKDLVKPTVSTSFSHPSASSLQGVSLLNVSQVSKMDSKEAADVTNKPVPDKSKLEVSNNYYDCIGDHDYCSNVPFPKNFLAEQEDVDLDENGKENCENISENNCKENKSKNNVDLTNVDTSHSEEVIDVLEEISQSDLNHICGSEESNNTSDGKFSSSAKSKQSKSKRNYRKQETNENDDDKYFDKIPAYYTTLSIRKKEPNKSVTGTGKVPSRAGIRVEDFFERNPSPERDPNVYNKLPAYYSCFTNSTKYDDTDLTKETPELEKGTPTCQVVSKACSSGYSSRSHSPSLVIDSRRCSRSPSKPKSYSRTSHSRSYSRSRSPETRRSRKRSWRKERRRQSSYSSGSRSSSRSSYSSDSSHSSPTRLRSRSRSHSHSSRYSYKSPSRYSRSRSRYNSRSRSRYDSRSRSRSYSRSRSRSLSRQRSVSRERDMRREERKDEHNKNKMKQMEERRIIYVGRIPRDFTRHDMRKRFEIFGEIEHVQLHFREHGDNYGFVTFAYTCDAYAAVQKGNKYGDTRFDLCFGGRRQFCETEYEDLDGDMELMEEFNPLPKKKDPLDFDQLLQQAKKKIGK